MRNAERRAGSIVGNERGVALVIAVLVMITATCLGLAAVMTSDIETRISGNQRCSEKSFYAADAGIDRGLAWLIGQADISPPDEKSLPTMGGTEDEFDTHCRGGYRITDMHCKTLPPPGWELTMFEKHYFKVDSNGWYEVNNNRLASKRVEVIASVVFPKP